MTSRRRVSAALIGLLVLVAGGWLGQQVLTGLPGAGPSSAGRLAVASATGLPARPLSQLPPQAAQVWQLIQHGGPFPYRQDGITFGNREGRLPRQQSGYYREYTVPTPEAHERGPRRLVTGGAAELYYTEDHYASFVSVDPKR